MRQFLWKSYLLLWVLILPLLTHKALHDFTGHFHIGKIDTFYPEELEQYFSKESSSPIDISGWEFRYIGRGNHAFAFESLDGNYVIKFLRYQKFLPHFWERLPWFNQRLEKSIAKRKERLRFLLNSISLAKDHLQDETGFLHISMLSDNKRDPQISLYDRFHRKVTIPAEKYSYILQKKFPLYGKLLPREPISKEKADKLFSAYFEVIASRFSKGIMNKDRRGWGKNYGLFSDVAWEIDLGGFAKAADDDLAWEISQCSRDFRTFVAGNAPQYLPLFDKRLKEAISLQAKKHYQKRIKKKR